MLDIHSLIYAFDTIFLKKTNVDTRALFYLDEENSNNVDAGLNLFFR